MNNNFEKYLGIANHDIQMANTSQELKSYVASILYENDKKVEEIDRLNNIINELEKTISQRIDLLNERKKEESIYAEVTSKLDELYFIYGKLKRIKG